MSVIDKAQEKIANILDKASNMKVVSKIAGNQKANFHNNMKNADNVKTYNMNQSIKDDIKKDKLKEKLTPAKTDDEIIKDVTNEIRRDRIKEKLTPDKTDEELIRDIKNKKRKDELEEKLFPKKTDNKNQESKKGGKK